MFYDIRTKQIFKWRSHSLILTVILVANKQTGYNLRARGHGLSLPDLQFDYLRKNFIYRMLYWDIY